MPRWNVQSQSQSNDKGKNKGKKVLNCYELQAEFVKNKGAFLLLTWIFL